VTRAGPPLESEKVAPLSSSFIEVDEVPPLRVVLVVPTVRPCVLPALFVTVSFAVSSVIVKLLPPAADPFESTETVLFTVVGPLRVDAPAHAKRATNGGCSCRGKRSRADVARIGDAIGGCRPGDTKRTAHGSLSCRGKRARADVARIGHVPRIGDAVGGRRPSYAKRTAHGGLSCRGKRACADVARIGHVPRIGDAVGGCRPSYAKRTAHGSLSCRGKRACADVARIGHVPRIGDAVGGCRPGHAKSPRQLLLPSC